MTYLAFLALFLAPPVLLLGALAQRGRAHRRGADSSALSSGALLAGHALLALAYTGPWDSYLVATGVWWYDPRRVLGPRVGWVPVEEYGFFVLQTLMTGLWVIWLEPRLRRVQAGRWTWRCPLTAAGAGLLWLGALALRASGWVPGTYLALELLWALPPITLQLAFGADILWRRRALLLPAILAPTVYLSLADRLAISLGCWTVNPARSTGVLVAGVLPIEELLFFALTNTLIAFGMALGLTPESWRRLRHWRGTLARVGRTRQAATPQPERAPTGGAHAPQQPASEDRHAHCTARAPAVVVIGAGLGGLAVAARLARAGCRVTVFEKQARPGGRLGL
ncbi:MAG: lycopene cyclase domain-containing protein, partial [Anaerolineae bacterium]|nr:lycopene cyclase domain-containing protein [Anaerolineae bacterium]